MRVQGTSRRRLSFLFCLVSLGWMKPALAVGVKKVPVLGGQAWGGWVAPPRASCALLPCAQRDKGLRSGPGRGKGLGFLDQSPPSEAGGPLAREG